MSIGNKIGKVGNKNRVDKNSRAACKVIEVNQHKIELEIGKTTNFCYLIYCLNNPTVSGIFFEVEVNHTKK